MTVKLIGSMALGCLLAAGAGRATAQTPTDDKTFLKTAGESDLAEITESKMVLQKSKNKDLRRYAAKMVSDHEMLTAKTKPFADKYGLAPASLLTTSHQSQCDKLRRSSGKSFDRLYIAYTEKNHADALALFQREVAATQDADLKATVSDGEKVVAVHKQMIDDMGFEHGCGCRDRAVGSSCARTPFRFGGGAFCWSESRI